MTSRLVALDTETTGLSPKQGHRIVEIGCVEIISRKVTGNDYQTYINPERELDEGAARVTGLSFEFLKDKPKFIEIGKEFLNYIQGAELVIHNAAFDLGFLNFELKKAGLIKKKLEDDFKIIDTLALARKMYPQQKNNLDALCKRLHVDNAHRKHHGALLDSEILAEVYLAMTKGQISFTLNDKVSQNKAVIKKQTRAKIYNSIKVIKASKAEIKLHEEFLERL